MVGIIESILLLAVGIALVLIARRIHIEDITNKVLYIIGIVLVVVGLFLLLFAILTMVL